MSGDIKILDIEPNAGTYTCTRFTIEHDGVTYMVEEWFTDSASGMEVYDESGANCVNGSAPDEVLEWDPNDDMRVTNYWGRYQGEVVPLMSKIAKEVLRGVCSVCHVALNPTMQRDGMCSSCYRLTEEAK